VDNYSVVQKCNECGGSGFKKSSLENSSTCLKCYGRGKILPSQISTDD